MGDEFPIVRFYCDSSSIRGHKYMVAGGFVVNPGGYSEAEAHIASLKKSAGIRGEMKWSEYRGGGRRRAYEALIDYGFSLVRAQNAAFHCIVSKFGEFNHRWGGSGTPEDSVSKMYTQIAIHRLGRFYGGTRRIVMHPDDGNDSRNLPNFRHYVCAQSFKTYSTKPNCIRDIEPLMSDQHGVLQMADVVVGAIAAACNNTVQSKHKRDLAAYVGQSAQYSNWLTDTPAENRLFTVWNFINKKTAPTPLDPEGPRPD